MCKIIEILLNKRKLEKEKVTGCSLFFGKTHDKLAFSPFVFNTVWHLGGARCVCFLTQSTRRLCAEALWGWTAELPLQKSMRINTSHTSPPPTAVMLESRNPTMFLWPLRSRWNTDHKEQKEYEWAQTDKTSQKYSLWILYGIYIKVSKSGVAQFCNVSNSLLCALMLHLYNKK